MGSRMQVGQEESPDARNVSVRSTRCKNCIHLPRPTQKLHRSASPGAIPASIYLVRHKKCMGPLRPTQKLHQSVSHITKTASTRSPMRKMRRVESPDARTASTHSLRRKNCIHPDIHPVEKPPKTGCSLKKASFQSTTSWKGITASGGE